MIIHEITNYNGPSLSSYIASGSNGDVYNSSNQNKVIKITSYTKSRIKALEYIFSNESSVIAKIYSFGVYDKYIWYESEKLNQINSQVESLILDFCIWLFINHRNKIKEKIDDLYSKSFSGLKAYNNMRFVNREKLDEYLPSIILFLDELNKYKMVHNDLNSGNIMKTNLMVYKAIDQESFVRKGLK